MWERTHLKEKAKKVLKGNYWQAFIVSLIILITGGSHNHGEVGGAGGTEAGNATNAELYLKLRQNAIANGLTSKDELNIIGGE